MSAEAAEELSLILRSGWRFVALESAEETRAVSLIAQVAKKHKRACFSWSLASGLTPAARSRCNHRVSVR